MANDCEQLSRELALLRAEVAKLRPVDENRIIQATRSAIQPDILTAVAAAGVIITNKLQPQINSAFNKAKEALGLATGANSNATSATSRATIADLKAQQAIRDAEIAQFRANAAQGKATEAELSAIRAYDKAVSGEAAAASAKSTANSAQSIAKNSTEVSTAAKRAAEIADLKASTAAAEALRASTSAEVAAGIGRNGAATAKSAEEIAQIARANARNALNTVQGQSAAIEVAKQNAALAKGLANQADFKAGRAVNMATGAMSDAARAAGQVLNVASDVTGLKGVVKGVGSQLNNLGNAIGKLEASVGKAISSAAEAIGISKGALAATGKLAGQVLQIFNVIATIFTILDGMATREVLGARVDRLENMILALGGEISGILGRLLGLRDRVGRAEVVLGAVRDVAITALGIGQAANSLAASAQSAANRASGQAVAAQGAAIQAQTTADGAVRNAKQANDNATTAFAKATEATTTASGAKNAANTATQKAGEAFGKAVEALGVALTAIALVQTVRSLRGIPGRDGRNGINGINGKDGITTIVTLPGIPGRQGERGFPGISGLPGRNGRDGINGINGRDGKDGKDVNPGDLAGLRSLIIQQHNQTRLNSTAQHSATRTTTLTPIMAALAPILALLKQIYDALMAASNAAILALLNIVNTKLGNQVVGGISGLVTRVAENTYVDKALSVLTFAATMHNALMLSNNLAVTLMGIIDQVTGAIMPKGIDGNPIVLSEVINKTVQALVISSIGQENYTKLQTSWALANRIYQATANVFNQVVSLGGLLTTGMELIGGNVGKIGNALRKGGVLLENAYQWMNPQPNMKGKFFTFANNAQETLSMVENVVQVPIGIKQAIDGIGSSNAELQREIAQIDPTDGNGNPIKDKEGKIIHYKDGITQPEPTVIKQKGEQAKADSTNFLELAIEDIFDGGD